MYKQIVEGCEWLMSENTENLAHEEMTTAEKMDEKGTQKQDLMTVLPTVKKFKGRIYIPIITTPPPPNVEITSNLTNENFTTILPENDNQNNTVTESLAMTLTLSITIPSILGIGGVVIYICVCRGRRTVRLEWIQEDNESSVSGESNNRGRIEEEEQQASGENIPLNDLAEDTDTGTIENITYLDTSLENTKLMVDMACQTNESAIYSSCFDFKHPNSNPSGYNLRQRRSVSPVKSSKIHHV